MPHKRIARTIWIYCVGLILVAITMGFFTEIFPQCYYRPLYGQNHWRYFPNGHYSYLRIGDINEKVEEYGIKKFKCTPILMGRYWEELPEQEPDSPYTSILNVFHTYDSDNDSKSFGRGIVLRIYDLDNEIANLQGNEKLAYEKIMNAFVTDSSFYKRSKNFAPYAAFETPTYALISERVDSVIFKKEITMFANNRAYELIFYVDKNIKKTSNSNTLDFLDAEFMKTAKKLDLHSYREWQEQESQYLNNLKIKRSIFITLYIICILGAVAYAFRYYRNTGHVNLKAAKITRIISIINIVIFLILGIGGIVDFCSIHYENIYDMYEYRFAAYIDDKYAATSVLIYGAYFLLFIIPTNRFYLKSYSQPEPKVTKSRPKHGLTYWFVRPFVLISKFFANSTKAIKDEYNKQMSDNK